MKKNIFYLPILIILLLIFVPAAVYGLYTHKTQTGTDTTSSGIVSIKDKNGTVLATYTCVSDFCNELISRVDDEYLEYNKTDNTTVGLINNKYVFIQDGNVKLYDIDNNEVVAEFGNVKTYGYSTTKVIASNLDGLYGIYDTNELGYTIEPKYKFIGTINDNDIELNLSKMVVNLDNKWYLMDSSENAVSSYFDKPITYYNSSYIVTKTDTGYRIYSVNGSELFTDISIAKIIVNGNYVMLADANNNVKVYDNGTLAHEYVTVSNPVFERNKNGLELFSNNQLIVSIGVD